MIEQENTVQTADGTLDMFVCHPEEGGPFPAVVLYMDAPGIREELRDMARRIGTMGYVAVLPNLYYRTGTEGNYGYDLHKIHDEEAELNKMFECMYSLSNAKVVADTGPILDYLKSHDQVIDGRVGCVGYCMSGQFVVAVGAAHPEFAAIASFYGVGIITDKDDSPHLNAGNIKGELYMAFAAKDMWVPDDVLNALPRVMTDAGVKHRIEMYPDTDHGFAFPLRDAYSKPAAERHWERLAALYDRQLRG
jgi:carboxymethylenebutenolidase